MMNQDVELARRVRDVVAVVTDDMDSVSFDVEDGVAYIEGVVPSDERRRAITNAVAHVSGLDRVVMCLATEHVLPNGTEREASPLYPPQVFMHYFAN